MKKALLRTLILSASTIGLFGCGKPLTRTEVQEMLVTMRNEVNSASFELPANYGLNITLSNKENAKIFSGYSSSEHYYHYKKESTSTDNSGIYEYYEYIDNNRLIKATNNNGTKTKSVSTPYEDEELAIADWNTDMESLTTPHTGLDYGITTIFKYIKDGPRLAGLALNKYTNTNEGYEVLSESYSSMGEKQLDFSVNFKYQGNEGKIAYSFVESKLTSFTAPLDDGTQRKVVFSWNNPKTTKPNLTEYADQ
ncbi:MAG: hypothetical protein K5694_02525 [Bacilli bacterium]|nr:hypothetical protein [Bacilli bacterium]